MVLVDIAAATICFLGQCYPALVGPTTPQGTFQIEQVRTKFKGYGGDVLLFKETQRDVYAIHRVWLGKPQEKRLERLQSADVKQRQTITNGCINVMPDVYAKLLDCCSKSQLTVK